MEAEQVVEKILADARAEADRIKKQAQEKEAAEQAKLNEQLEEHRKQTEVLAEKAGKDKKSHILAAARMEIAKEFLSEKRKILDEVFVQARRQLQNLPDEEYRTLCTKLMVEAVETGDEEVIVDNNENRIDQQLINQVNKQLGSGNKGKLKLTGVKQDIGGGFILRQGKIKTNVSIEILLNQVRKELEIELAKKLFS